MTVQGTIPLPLVTQHFDFPQTAAERTVNWYAEKIGADPRGKTIWALRTTPGLASFGTLAGSGGIRPGGMLGVVAAVERFFVVRGDSFQEWDDDNKVFVERGQLESATGRVGMAHNGRIVNGVATPQVLVVDGTKGYLWDTSDNTWHTNIPNFPGGVSCALFYNLRFYTIQPNTGNIWCSNQDDGLTWSGTAFVEEETLPDPALALESTGQSILALGSNSYAFYLDQGLPDIPIRRVQAGQSIGLSAPGSAAGFGGSVFWLGGSPEGKGIVYRTHGYGEERISDPMIEQAIANMSDISDAVGFVYQEQGHPFYWLTFGAGNKTFAYDLSTGIWAERKWRNPATGDEGRSFIIAQATYKGKTLVGDLRNGNVYEMSRKYFTDAGDPIVREKILPVWPNDSFVFTSMPAFFVAMDMGNTPEGFDAPKLMLSWSDDRGKTWSRERTAILGLIGEYGKRIVFNGMGSSYGRNYKIRLTGNQEFTLRLAGMLE